MFAMPACYTLFKHPRLAELDYARPESDRCETSHTADDLWTFTHPANVRRTGGAWEYYYQEDSEAGDDTPSSPEKKDKQPESK